MLISLVRNWWAVGLVGALAIFFGVMAFVMPGITLATLVVAFGIYALAAGACLVAAGATGEPIGMATSRGWIVAAGVLSIVTGLVTLAWPGITAVTLYAVIATWAIMAGLAQLVAAIVHRHEREHTWLVALGGLAMAAFGVYMALTPAGALALAYALGAYALTYGALMLVASIPLKQAKDAVRVTVTRIDEAAAVREEELTRR